MAKIVTYHGRRIEFMELIDEKGLWMSFQAIRDRIRKGWSVNRAFDTPITKGTWKRVNNTNEEAKAAYMKRCKSSVVGKR